MGIGRTSIPTLVIMWGNRDQTNVGAGEGEDGEVCKHKKRSIVGQSLWGYTVIMKVSHSCRGSPPCFSLRHIHSFGAVYLLLFLNYVHLPSAEYTKYLNTGVYILALNYKSFLV